MSAPAELPKGFLRTMLERLLPRGLKGEMVRGDLLEEFRGLAERSSERQARAWYRRQSRRILWTVARGRISRLDLKSGVPAARESVFGSIIEDANYALRRFRKEPGYAAVAIVTIAIGIGANTAIFSVLDAVILRPLPYPEPERLVQIWRTNSEVVAERNLPNADITINALNYNDYAEHNQTLSGIAYTYRFPNGHLAVGAGDGAPEWVPALGVSGSFFSVLGIEPALGRSFLPEEVAPEAPRGWGLYPPVVIMTHDLWARRYDSDADIIGREILLNGRPSTVVGVLPERFAFPPISSNGRLLPTDAGLYLPLHWVTRGRTGGPLAVLGRIAPGRTLEQVQSDLGRISSGLGAKYPEIGEGWSLGVTPIHQWLVRDFGGEIYVLMGIVGFVLLIACVNLAHLLLAMGSRRQAELAVRLAIGASRRRQIQLLLTESLLLSLFGGGIGLVVARSGLNTLLALVPADVPRAAEAGLDGTVLLFTVGVSLTTGLLFGLLPAFRASDINLVEALRATKSADPGGRRRASSRTLIVVQVALTLMLLVGGSILGKSFFQLRAVERGFRTDNVLVMEMRGGRFGASLASREEKSPRLWSDTYRILEAVRSTPGVISVSLGAAPLSGRDGWDGWDAFQFEEYEEKPAPAEETTPARITYVSPGYFETLGIPIIRGEGLPEWDGVNDWRRYSWSANCTFCDEMDEYGTVVVSESFAAGVWPGQDPIGKKVGLYGCCWTVAGVARDVSFRGVDDREAWTELRDNYRVYIPWTVAALLVRTATDPLALAPAIRETILSLDDMRTIDVSTLDGRIYDSLARPRFHMLIGAIFAAVALLLALVGLYGVVAYTVAQRTHEIGIRIALGARRGDIRALVVRGGLAPVVLGVVLGIAGSLASVRVLEALLYGMSALDPSLIAGLAVTLVLVTAAACYVPARRASAMDPVSALTHE